MRYKAKLQAELSEGGMHHTALRRHAFAKLRAVSRAIALLVLSSGLSSCYFVEYFGAKKKQEGEQAMVSGSAVLGLPLGPRAGSLDEAQLALVHATAASLPPASVRADPDMYARRLLLQYRQEGSTIAREIGAIEGFRLLLGGASSDFQKKPQEDFDATSLLANLTVAERICRGLVAPDAREHEGWDSILPAAASDWQTNILFLAQRFLGKPSAKIEASIISSLKGILDTHNTDGRLTYDDYIEVCASLALDAEALLL